MHEAFCALIAAGGNRHPAAADIDSRSGLVAFGAGRNIALWYPSDGKAVATGIGALLCGHTDDVNVVIFLHIEESRDLILLSGSADSTIRIWRRLDRSRNFACCTILESHGKSINAITVLPQRRIFVSGAADSRLKIWTYKSTLDGFQTEMLQTVALTPKFFPLCLALSSLPASNSVVLAVAGSKTFVQIFISNSDGNEFSLAATLTGHEGWIRSLQFREDKLNLEGSVTDLLLASASQDKYIRLWRLHSGDPLPPVSKAASDPVLGSLGASLSNKAHRLESGDSRYSITFEALLVGHEDWIYSVRWDNSSDDLRLLSASADNSLAIWEPDLASGVWTCTVRLGQMSAQKGATTATGSTGGFWIGLWHDKARAVLSLGRTGSWRLWIHEKESDMWMQKPAVSGHTREVLSLAWARNGSYLLSTGADQTTRMFATVKSSNAQCWHEYARPQIHGYDLNCIDTISNTQFISGADEKLLRVFDIPKAVANLVFNACGIELGAKNALPEAAHIPVLGLSNKEIVAQEDDAEIFNGDSEERENVEALLSDDPIVSKIFQPPLEDHLARHLLWPETEKLYGHGYEISSVAASNDGTVVATACRASSADHAVIRIFRTSDWREVKPSLNAHSLTVTRLRFSLDDAFLVSAGRDRQCALFARDTEGSEVYSLAAADPKAHTRMLLDVSWAPQDEGYVFATAGRDKNVHVWKFSEGKLTKCSSIAAAASATAVAFLPRTIKRHLILACGLENGTIFIRDVIGAALSLGDHLVNIDSYLLPSLSITELAWRPEVNLSSDVEAELAVASEDSSVRILKMNLAGVMESS